MYILRFFGSLYFDQAVPNDRQIIPWSYNNQYTNYFLSLCRRERIRFPFCTAGPHLQYDDEKQKKE